MTTPLRLSQATGVAYIAPGALPRAEIARGGDLGRRFAPYTSSRSRRAMKRGSSAGRWMVVLRRLAAHDCAARGRSRRWWPCRLART
jgi:hypothetical protein